MTASGVAEITRPLVEVAVRHAIRTVSKKEGLLINPSDTLGSLGVSNPHLLVPLIHDKVRDKLGGAEINIGEADLSLPVETLVQTILDNLS